MSYLLLLGEPGVGKCRLLEKLINDFENVIWITTVYSFEKVRERIGDKAWIVDVFSWGMKEVKSEKDLIVANPTNMNEISLAVSKVLQKIKKDYLLILNSISGLSVYQPLSKVMNLLRVLLMKIEGDKAKAVFTLVTGAQDRQFEIGTMMLFPCIVELLDREVRVLKSFSSEIDKGDYNVERAKEILSKLLSS
ncbi:MAG: hypothetical protein RMH75_03735 [Archaeoglobaceae archaeon]|nr:hypothetical protein [Archaeoglobaceae archaeon]MDW7989764.1 hypothetical protein [Archaeoglobaceae archaeon]